MRIVDDDPDPHAEGFRNRLPNRLGGGIRILGEHCHPLWAEADVAVVDPGVRADESQPVFGNDQPRPHAQHSTGLIQDNLAQSRVFFRLFRQLQRPRSRSDLVQIDDAAFGLGDDLLRDDQDI